LDKKREYFEQSFRHGTATYASDLIEDDSQRFIVKVGDKKPDNTSSKTHDQNHTVFLASA